ncbi:hypothetical protein KFU94_01330 [Chloroflexi bacterium TSY]|nr:hypothetical protein [Chloroflexi bacterium TSY]
MDRCGSAELLLHLGKRLAGYPILIVGAYRPNDVALGQDGTRHPLAQVIHESQRDFGEILLDLDQAQGDAFVNA